MLLKTRYSSCLTTSTMVQSFREASDIAELHHYLLNRIWCPRGTLGTFCTTQATVHQAYGSSTGTVHRQSCSGCNLLLSHAGVGTGRAKTSNSGNRIRSYLFFAHHGTVSWIMVDPGNTGITKRIRKSVSICPYKL